MRNNFFCQAFVGSGCGEIKSKFRSKIKYPLDAMLPVND